MRDEKIWRERQKEFYLNSLPPRIQNVLRKLEELDNGDNPISSTFICGKAGYGKTILAAQLMLAEQKRIWFNNGPKDNTEKCIFVSTPELFQEIKQTYGPRSSATEQEVIRKYNECGLLVLDDFGADKPTDWVLSILYLIINHRYDYLKTTIFTSNLSLPEITEFFGDERISSRIDRMCDIIEKTPWNK